MHLLNYAAQALQPNEIKISYLILMVFLYYMYLSFYCMQHFVPFKRLYVANRVCNLFYFPVTLGLGIL